MLGDGNNKEDFVIHDKRLEKRLELASSGGHLIIENIRQILKMQIEIQPFDFRHGYIVLGKLREKLNLLLDLQLPNVVASMERWTKM